LSHDPASAAVGTTILTATLRLDSYNSVLVSSDITANVSFPPDAPNTPITSIDQN